MIGKTIHHYRIIEKLGEGGMGEVYLAKDTTLDRNVALKFLPLHYTEDAGIKKRFEREAQAAAALNHPNLITIYEINQSEGRSYIAMEYVEGNSLRTELDRGLFPIERITYVFTQMCRGLNKAHQAHIVHRDIKPANILIAANDQVKILDFGLAMLAHKTRITLGGTTVGTISYMSPEQHRGELADTRSDIWSLGVVLYEMITGQLPFRGEYDQVTIYRILHEQPESVLKLRNNISGVFDHIVTKCLQKEADSRYQNIDDIIADLRPVSHTRERSEHTADILSQHDHNTTEPETIGNYRLIASLGEGGMGIVYLAEQTEPLNRRVALKLIKLGMDTQQVVARFETERQALAVMDHPNIAKVYDAGSTETGRPYFVMEYVVGIPLNEYCDKNGLTLPKRLELFIELCHAIQHAHQKGVIHRDLKPSNVMVTVKDDKPILKIIDFGVAKAIGHSLTDRTLFTEQGQLIGTPAYMSPEQAEMSGLDIDTRTDIYSLGVILHELLIGVLPYDPGVFRTGSISDIQRLIRETDPPKCSTRFGNLGDSKGKIAVLRKTEATSLFKQLKGDLDVITAKAMAKDRTQRYPSASELATDIDRHLKHEPILATPPTTLYRLRKYIRRHKTGVAAAALVILAMVIGITGTSIGLIRAKQAENTAKSEAQTAKEISGFLQGLFEVSNPGEARGNTITAREILDKGAEKINTELKDQPRVQARMMNTIGIVYWRLGLYERATSLLRQALEIQRRALGDKHPEVSESLNGLAILYYTQGDYPAAEGLFREALSIQRLGQGDELNGLADCLNNLAMTLKAQGKFDKAEPMYWEALAIRRKLLGDENKEVAQSLNNMGRFLYDQGKNAEAERLLRESLAMNLKLLGPEHPEISANLSNLALVLRARGDYGEAETMLRQVLALDKKLLGVDHPYVGATLEEIGILQMMKGDYVAAEKTLRAAIDVKQKTFPEKHWKMCVTQSLLGSCLTNLGQYESAEKLVLESYQSIKSQFSKDNAHTRGALKRIVELYESWNKSEKADLYRAMLVENDSKQ